MTGPTFDGQEIIDETLSFLGSIPPEQIKEMLTAANTELEQFRDVEQTYFVLGNYDTYPKRRVERVRDGLAGGREGSVSFLLDEVDPDETIWKNFYVKFRVFLRRADYVVLVAEDNDGGHELEVGEVPNEKLYVLKRDYDGASLDPPTTGRSARSPTYGDIDHDRFDAMLLTMFAFLESEDRLFSWSDLSELDQCVERLLARTES
jgi:hypothetical protein